MISPDLSRIKTLLSSPSNVAILTHSNPDGDAMGSSLGLANYLSKMGHNAKVIVPNDYPSFLSWMPGCGNTVVYERHKKEAAEIIRNAAIIFCLDFNTLKRIGEPGDLVQSSKAYKVMIDHHQQPDTFPDLLISDVKGSSTAELVYDFLVRVFGNSIDPETGICLYTGIMTDTASFRFPSASSHTLRVAASLKDAGVKTWKAHEAVYDSNTEDRLKLIGYALAEKLVVLKDVNTAFISLSMAELQRFNFRKGDTEGLVNYCLSLENIRLGVFFMEKENEIKLSLRSKGLFDVNAMARKHFNGGGHVNAAGGSLTGSLDEAINTFKNILPSYADQLVSSE